MKMKSNENSGRQRFLLFSMCFLISGALFSNTLIAQVQAIGKYLSVNYKPFFPIGLYSFPDNRRDDGIWKEAADAGFNFVLSDESGKYGMYVSRKIPSKKINGQNYSLMELHRDESMLGELKDFLAKYENDPTMICWHAPDEPSYFGPSAAILRPGYEAIKKNSNKPVWLNIGPSFTVVKGNYNPPRDFYRACDILSEDIYPIPEEKRKPSQGYNEYAYFVGEHTRNLIELGSIDGVQNTPIWMVLQGFSWGDLTPEKNIKEFPAPTLHQLRYMYYDAIVHGATGILIWGVRSTKTAHGAQIWKDLKTMASELRDHYDIWTCPFELLPEKLRISIGDNTGQENSIHLMIKLLNDKVYILAVNTRNTDLKNVTFTTTEDGTLSKVNVLCENRQVPVNGKTSFTDSFKGYGVHIYETDIFFRFMRRYYKDPNAPAGK